MRWINMISAVKKGFLGVALAMSCGLAHAQSCDNPNPICGDIPEPLSLSFAQSLNVACVNSPYVSVLEFMTNGNLVNTGNATVEVGGVAAELQIELREAATDTLKEAEPLDPMNIAVIGPGVKGSAVIATKPAKAPLSIITISVLPPINLVIAAPVKVPAAPAKCVFTAILEIALTSSNVPIAN